MLADDDPTVRSQAAALLLGHDSEARPTLVRAARDPSSRVRAGALRGIAAARIGRRVSIAFEALADPNAEVRAEALRAIAATAPKDAVASLIDALADEIPACVPPPSTDSQKSELLRVMLFPRHSLITAGKWRSRHSSDSLSTAPPAGCVGSLRKPWPAR